MDPRAYGGKFLPQGLEPTPRPAPQCTRRTAVPVERMRALYRVAIQVAGSDAPGAAHRGVRHGQGIFARLAAHAEQPQRSAFRARQLRGCFPASCSPTSSSARAGASPGPRAAEGQLRARRDGTLFLDEVGGVPVGQPGGLPARARRAHLQAPGGRTRDLGFRARIVAATTAPCPTWSAPGAFAPDLSTGSRHPHRLALPARAQRRHSPLAEYFLWLSGTNTTPRTCASPRGHGRAHRHRWPGQRARTQEPHGGVACCTPAKAGHATTCL
jgi:hypothetical protein